MWLTYFARRLGAAFYDGLLLFAFWLLSTLGLVLLTGRTQVAANSSTLSRIPYWFFLLVVAWLFFSWFWTHGGQTLGMRAWKLRLETTGTGMTGDAGFDRAVGWSKASRRFFAALLVWVLSGTLIPAAWNVIKAEKIPFSAGVVDVLCVWVAVALSISLLPLPGKLSVVDRISGTRVVVIAP